MADQEYDVAIVGSGVSGSLIANALAGKGLKVLVLEAGPGIGRSREDVMENFFLNPAKTPESPYPPNDNALDPAATNAPRATILATGVFTDPAKSYLTFSQGSLPFAGTYERIEGGTSNHWVGTCLRMEDNDFRLRSQWTGDIGLDWPIGYSDLVDYYGKAETALGVAAEVSEQEKTHITFPSGYQYPMRPVTSSLVDASIASAVDGKPLTNEDFGDRKTLVTNTPAARNTQPYQGRRVCHGNTNCTPICPIQAKYDATITLNAALRTGNVRVLYKTVVSSVSVDADGNVSGLNYLTYDDVSVPAKSGATGGGTATARIYVLAAHAMENAKLLLNSPIPGSTITVANSSDMVGRNLMDHPTYLTWGLMPAEAPVFPYRGPLSTSGIETLRDGPFREHRAAWRIEIGNEGWNWPANDPYTTVQDFINGTNNSQLNPSEAVLYGDKLVSALNDLFTRQFRCAFLVEQNADPDNRVQLSTTQTDNLGIPRPLVTYQLSDYTKAGFESAATAARSMMNYLSAEDYTRFNPDLTTSFVYNGVNYNYQSAGHVCGTHIMGNDSSSSVVDSYQQSWDHPNLFIAGCGSMPSIGTENPTLTMSALALRTSEKISSELGSA